MTDVLHILSFDFYQDIWTSIVLGELDLGQWGTDRVAVPQLLGKTYANLRARFGQLQDTFVSSLKFYQTLGLPYPIHVVTIHLDGTLTMGAH